MNYDLYFDRREPLTEEEFFAYFDGRRNYKRENRQAWYQNERTGVYFSFVVPSPGDSEELEKRHQASFNLNLYRPHFFGLEAAPELDAFVKRFGFTVIDPQERDSEVFSIERFLSNWNRSNEFGYKALLNAGQTPRQVQARPSTELEAIWRWNYELPRIQEELGKGVFVPRVVWLNIEGVLNSAVIWGDGIATLIPAVEKIVIPRNEMAPKKMFSRQRDLCMVEQSQLDRCLAPLETGKYPLPSRVPGYRSPPERVKRFVRGLVPQTRKIEGVPMDRVLNAELVRAGA